MNGSRRYIWCILLKLSIEDIYTIISINDLVQNADKTLLSQVNCDINRCDLTSDDKFILKQLVTSVFSYRKDHYSYIQGIHEIGRVFLSLFYKYKKSNLSVIKRKLRKLNIYSKSSETIVLCKLLINKFNSERGRMDICFKAFDKFIMLYSTPYIFKLEGKVQISLEHILSNVLIDLINLLSQSSTALYHFFTSLNENDGQESRICIFILPWIITCFSHNISIHRKDLIYYIFENIISNHPIYIIFLVKEILIQCETNLFDFLKQEFGSEFLQAYKQDEIYPLVHLFFQNLDISSLNWKVIIENSHKSVTNTRLDVLNSYCFWEFEKKSKGDFRIGMPFRLKIDEKTILYSMLIILILSFLVLFILDK